MQTTVPLYGFGGESGKSGGTLTVQTTAGVTITVSKDGKTYTKTADTSGKAVFRGLETGIWTVRVSDGTSTNEDTVSINVDYTKALTV